MSIQTDNVSSSTTVSRIISPECIQHFAVQPRVSVLEWAHTNSNSVILYPQTYFSTSDSFTLTPQSYIVATICDVPANRHTVGNCSLLRGAFDPVQYAVCLVVTNISHAIQIDVPRHCDLFRVVDNPFVQVEVCYLDINDLSPHTL